ncbi:hypothetical protein HYX16_05765 [Candidatus Woesearchaeota archaeon]|nr:hypothetical protein [Candidatus Woesearchaeota archaeon]
MPELKQEKKPNLRERFLEGLFGVREKIEEKKEKSLGMSVGGKYGVSKTSSQKGFRLVLETMQSGVESNYYWFLRFMENKEDFGLQLSGENGKVMKLKDIMAAGEASSLWGSMEQRKALQQEKVSGYLATIGKMIKDMFQIIRELRIMDERLQYYKDYNSGDQAGSVALKSVWVDLVEGGAKNPGSVTGLASQVGFVTLPDLFYRVHPKTSEEVNKMVDILKKDFLNIKVREVLSRKLKQFLIWKETTEKEITNRRKFVLAYLRQHFNTIRMYINWIKPYLRNIRQLQMGSSLEEPHLVSSFESSLIDLELLGVRHVYTSKTPQGFEIDKKFKKYFPCVLVKVKFIALPEMAYQKEYQRGPIHLGRTIIEINGHVATQKQINEYRESIDKEDLEIIASLDESLLALKDELFKYLEEAKESRIPGIKEEIIEVMDRARVGKEKALEALKMKGSVNSAIAYIIENKKQEGILTPFIGIFKGFQEILNISGKKPEEKELPLNKIEEESEKGVAKGEAESMAYILYDVYKKAHGLLNPL